MSFGFGVGDFIAVIDKLRHCHDRFSEAPDLFVSLVRNVQIIEPLLEEAHCAQQDLNDEEQKIMGDIIEGSYKDLKRLKQILDDCQELKKPLEKKRWDKTKILQSLQRLQLDPKAINSIQSSLSVKITLLNTLKNASDSRAIQITKQVVFMMHHEQVSKHQQEILEWLTPSNYTSQQRDHFSTRHPDTASWLIESKEFKWVSNKGQTLLCRGMPGAGKTIMTSVIVDHLVHRFREDTSVGIAYIYCNFEETEHQNCHDLLASLTKQLAQSRSSFPQSLETLYNTYSKQKTPRSIQETICLLDTIVSSYKRVFFVIDALDECDRNARLAFLPEIFRLQQRCQVNIFATTRDVLEIVHGVEFKDAISVEIRASEGDVLRYVSGRMTCMQSFVRSNPDIQKKISDTIVREVDGMFLLAKLLIDAWSQKLNPKELQRALRVFESRSGEENVYSSVYDEAMKRIQSQSFEQTELALKILSWITGTRRPLKVAELQHALAIEGDEAKLDQDNITPVETMVSVCAGLITISQPSGVIRLVHQTTQEYFEGIRHQLFPDVDYRIAKACAEYLCIADIYSERQVAAYSTWNEKEEHRRTMAPFFDYATAYWIEHTRVSFIAPPEVIGFLQNQAMLDRSLSVLKRLRLIQCIPRGPAQVIAYFGIIQLFETASFPKYEANSTDDSGKTALWWAAFGGQIDVVKLFLGTDAVSAGPLKGRISSQVTRSAMQVAIEMTHVEILEMLIAFYAKRRFGSDLKPDDKVSIFLEPMMELSLDRRVESLHRMRASRSNGRKFQQPSLTESGWRAVLHIIASGSDEWNRHKWIPQLFQLLKDCVKHTERSTRISRELLDMKKFEKGFAEAMKVLLDVKANINVRGPMGRTPLAQAVLLGLNSTVNVLLARGASVDIKDDYGEYPALLAAKTENWVALSSLVRYGATIEAQDYDWNNRDSDGRSPASSIARRGDASLLRLFVEKGADVRAQDSDGRTPMYWAIVSGNIPTLEIFLTMNVEIEYPASKEGRSPLSWAASHGNLEAVQLLLARGFEVDALDENGRTPLACACAISSFSTGTSIIRMLLAHGANTGAGHRNLVWVRIQARFDLEVVHLFRPHGFDICSKDAKGRTLLHYAAKSGRWEEFQMLFESTDLDLHLKDDDGRTVLWHAMTRRSSTSRPKILQLILDYTEAGHNCSNGLQAFNDAIEFKEWRFAELLVIRKLVNVDQAFDEEAPIVTAAKNGDPWAFMLLKNHGADLGKVILSHVEIFLRNSWRFADKHMQSYSHHETGLM